ncbi:MAG: tRNA epoxyqueuosine(34) reductase QueG [Defluviitaleaceae bacterium]|nr:tRNA epoxyqueuosine(34) reductase QueG [Defluviitaleaceae bacterium]
MNARDIIAEFAREKGCIIGVTGAGELEEIRDRLESTDTPFSVKDIQARTTPTRVLAGCKSIIVIGVPYGKLYIGDTDTRPRGKQTVMLASRDYHEVLREMLEELASRLRQYINFNYKIQIDSGPLYEREIARCAGFGFYGRNHLLISPTIGSFFNIGLMLVDVDIPPDSPIEQIICDDCGACMTHCPGNALAENMPLNWWRCISYITQKKGELSAEETAVLGTNIYGCDVCQQVCPHNQGKSCGEITDIELIYPDLQQLIEMDDEAFTRRYGNTSAGWRGLKVIQRNALVAMANLPPTEEIAARRPQ